MGCVACNESFNPGCLYTNNGNCVDNHGNEHICRMAYCASCLLTKNTADATDSIHKKMMHSYRNNNLDKDQLISDWNSNDLNPSEPRRVRCPLCVEISDVGAMETCQTILPPQRMQV